MRRSTVFFDDTNADLIAFSLYQGGETNRLQRERMKRILTRAIREELTDRQRSCLILYYLKGMKMREIARTLMLSTSTVSRHIRTAERKLRRIADYYE
ncbi:MAG: sigma-70 family RNA polymerase sigma factor [Ruminococcus sp.]|nr:sigma-70 family RNA polymerase sigma factor [Ruminococcus sp.]